MELWSGSGGSCVQGWTTSSLRICSVFLRLTERMYLNFKWAFLVWKGKGKTVFVIKLTIISKSKLPRKYFGMTLQWQWNVPGEWGIQFAEWHMRLYHNNIWNNNCCHVGHKETLNTGGKAQWISRRLDHLTFHFSTYNIMSPGNLDFASSSFCQRNSLPPWNALFIQCLHHCSVKSKTEFPLTSVGRIMLHSLIQRQQKPREGTYWFQQTSGQVRISAIHHCT